jgi:hypothetical protein
MANRHFNKQVTNSRQALAVGGKVEPNQRKSSRSGRDAKSKEPEVLIMKMTEEGPAKKHKGIKLEKMKKKTDSEGNIQFTKIK